MKAGILGLAVVLTLPVSYPAWVLREMWLRSRYDAFAAAVGGDVVAAAALGAVRAGEARRATEWVLIAHSIASGAEEDPPLYVIELRDGTRRVLDAASGARAALDEASVPTIRREAHARGLAVVVGAFFWVVSLVVLAAAVHGGAAPWALAVVLVALLAWFLAS